MRFVNVTLTGKYMIWSDCTQEWCTHCLTEMYLFQDSSGQNVTVIDRFQIDTSASYFERSQCNFFQGSLPNIQGVFFTLNPKANLTFQNVELNNIRVRAQHFILAEGGNSIGFFNTSISFMDFSQAFVAESASASEKVEVEFNGTYVTGFNRDHPFEYGVDAGLLFLNSSYIDVVFIRNSVFEYNFMLVSNAPYNQFISVAVAFFELTDSVFRACMGGFYFRLYDDLGTADQSRISKVTFDSNFCDHSHVFFLQQYSGNHALLIENSAIVNNLVQNYDIFCISTDYQSLRSTLNVTITNVTFSNNELSSIGGIIDFEYVTSVEIDGCTVSDNLIFDPSFQDNIFLYMLEHHLINDSPVLQAKEFSPGMFFSYQFLIDSPTYLNITQFHLHTNVSTSQYGLAVYILDDLKAAINITDSVLASGYCIEVYILAENPTGSIPVVYIRNSDVIGPSYGGIVVIYTMSSGGGLIVEGSRLLNNGTPDSVLSAIYVIGWFLNTSDCVFDSNQGTVTSSVFFIPQGNYTPVPEVYDRAVHILNCWFLNDIETVIILASGLSSYPLLLDISNCTFTNFTALSTGSVISLYQLAVRSVIIENCLFAYGVAYYQGVIDFSYVFCGSILIRDSRFMNIYSFVGVIIKVVYLMADPNMKASFVLENSSIRNCVYDVAIYSFIIDQTELYISSISNVFDSNNGTVVWIDLGTFIDSHSVFSNNFYSVFPCFYQTDVTVNSVFLGTVFRNNWATDTVGAIRLAGGSATFRNCRFEGNSAVNLAGVMQIEMRSNVSISECQFINNSAASAATLYLFHIDSAAPLYITNTVFIGNTGEGLLQMINSNLSGQNITIMENHSSSIVGILMIQSNLSLVNSSITQTTGTVGCVLYGVMGSSVLILGSSISDITCEQESLLLFSNLDSTLKIIESDLIRISSLTSSIVTLGNSGQLLLDSVHIEYIQSPLSVISLENITANVFHSVFSLTNSVVLLAAESTVQIRDSAFGNVMSVTDVGAVKCTKCWSVTLSNLTFTNVSAIITAGVNVTGSNLVSVERCRFEGLIGETYGALAVESESLSITDSWFFNNTATGEPSFGGAAFFSANFSVISRNVFSGNSATNGGALYWTYSKPENTSNVFEGNNAIYGSDIASYAVTMNLMNDSIPIVVSGQVYTGKINVELLDHYGQVVKTDSSSIAWISSVSSLTGNLKGTASQGVFSFSQFSVIATLDTKINITISTSDLTFTFPVYIRECVIGEIEVNKSCELCQPGTYSLTLNATACNMCLENADCLGNSTLYPKSGFWRPDELYDGVFQCPHAAAWLGNVNYTSSTGVCADGYTNNMCQSCASNYTRDGKDLCTPCLSQDSYIIGQTLLAFGICVFFAFLLMTSLANANNPENYSGVLFKIFMNYLHFTVLVGHFELLWPAPLEEMFHVFEYLGNSGEQFLLWICAEYHSFFTETLIIAILPAALILTNVALWAVVRCVTKMKEPLEKFICSLSICLIFIHPLIVRVAFSAFICVTIKSEEQWLRFEMDIKCWDSTHSRYALAAALPALIIWGFSLPIGALLLLIKSRSNAIRHGLSFLCVGYRYTRFYWEFVKILWKTSIIVLYIFMSQTDLVLQALTLCILLWVSAHLQYKFRPFKLSSINKTELRCIWVTIVTTYAGIWYSSETLSYTAEMALFTIVLLIHVYFLLIWGIFLIRTLFTVLIKTHPRFSKVCPRLQYYLHIRPVPPQQWRNSINTNPT